MAHVFRIIGGWRSHPPVFFNFSACEGEDYNQSDIWDENLSGTSLTHAPAQDRESAFFMPEGPAVSRPAWGSLRAHGNERGFNQDASFLGLRKEEALRQPRARGKGGNRVAQGQPEACEDVVGENRRTEIT